MIDIVDNLQSIVSAVTEMKDKLQRLRDIARDQEEAIDTLKLKLAESQAENEYLKSRIVRVPIKTEV